MSGVTRRTGLRRSGPGSNCGAARRAASLQLLGALALGAALIACSEAPPPPQAPPSRPVKLFTVENAVGDEFRSFPATIEASRQAELAFRVPGQLSELPIREGDLVEEGQVIAQLDPTDYRIALEDRQASFDNSQRNFQRAGELIGSGNISQLDYDRMEAEFRSARAALAQARANLGYTTLRAPFAGRIARRLVENYEEVLGKQTVVFLQDTDMLDVIIAMPESIVRSVSASEADTLDNSPSVAESSATSVSAMVSFEGRKDISYALEIKEIATRADPDTQTFPVTFTMPQPSEFTVLPGMTAQVELDFTGIMVNDSVTWVPVRAVQGSAGLESRVFVFDPRNSRVLSRRIEVGRMAGDMIEVLSGLAGGEEIVAVGAEYLADGMAVTRLPSGEQATPREDEQRGNAGP